MGAIRKTREGKTRRGVDKIANTANNNGVRVCANAERRFFAQEAFLFPTERVAVDFFGCCFRFASFDLKRKSRALREAVRVGNISQNLGGFLL